MMIANLPSERSGQEALERSIKGDIDAWRSFLDSHPFRDGIGVIQRNTNPHIVALVRSEGSPTADWLRRMVGTHDGTGLRGKAAETDAVHHILFETWNELHYRLAQQLSRRVGELPPAGYVLYFTEYLDWCLVLRYAFSGTAAMLKLVHVIPQPEAVYDLYTNIAAAEQAVRSVVRNISKSPAKLIAHRGILVHVDRNSEPSVFGPSIDTLQLLDAAANVLFESTTTVSNQSLSVLDVLEPGCGSGFVSAGLIANLASMERLVTFDVNIEAVKCTWRNIAAVRPKSKLNIHAVVGAFDSAIIGFKFDLVIVNPPYIPTLDLPTRGLDPYGSHEMAVGGTELLTSLVSCADELLKPHGAIVMIYSALADPEFQNALPSGFSVVSLLPGTQRAVLFDLEDVFDKPEWHNALIETRGLQWDEHSRVHRHEIKVVAIVRESELSESPPNSLAGRLATIINQN